MGGDVAATAGLCVMYGRVRHSTVGSATTRSKVQVEKERKNLRTLMRVLVCRQCGEMLVAGCTGHMLVSGGL